MGKTLLNKTEAIDAVESSVKKTGGIIIGYMAHESGRDDVIIFWTRIGNAARSLINVLFVTQKKVDGKVAVTKVKEGTNLQILNKELRGDSILWIKFSTLEDRIEEKEVQLADSSSLPVQK